MMIAVVGDMAMKIVRAEEQLQKEETVVAEE